jgi:phosphatidate cytidylyltransferase|tara:strand:+ start:53 stop:694 length:642 start_codon:yes stop_codon:yes gene_type:complete
MAELQKRIITSISLIIILYLSFVNILILSIVLLATVFLLFNEFYNIIKKILINRKNYQLTFLFLILLYLIYFSLDIWFLLNTDSYNNKNLLFFIIIICISTDIGGYAFGKIFKGKKLTSISPNKTYAGLIGSYLLSFVISLIFFNELNSKVNYLAITFIISSLSQIGDLIISYLKRKAKLKNSGTILPGHGGLLDRLDGILLATPIGLFLVTL